MNEELPPDWNEDAEPPTAPPHVSLGYRAPRDELHDQPAVPLTAQGILGFAAYVGALVAAAVVTAVLGGAGIFLGLLAGITVLVITSILARGYGWRGFIPGVLIGLGLTLLAVGACFVAVTFR